MDQKLYEPRVLDFGFRILGVGFRVRIPKYWGYIGIMEKKMETTILGLHRNSTNSLNSLIGGYTGDYIGNYYSFPKYWGYIGIT